MALLDFVSEVLVAVSCASVLGRTSNNQIKTIEGQNRPNKFLLAGPDLKIELKSQFFFFF